MLWDTAGQEEFDAITKAYYRGAQACVLAFSTTDRDSFEAAHSWKLKVSEQLKKSKKHFLLTARHTYCGMRTTVVFSFYFILSHLIQPTNQ